MIFSDPWIPLILTIKSFYKLLRFFKLKGSLLVFFWLGRLLKRIVNFLEGKKEKTLAKWGEILSKRKTFWKTFLLGFENLKEEKLKKINCENL